MTISYVDSPVGRIAVESSNDGRLLQIDFVDAAGTVVNQDNSVVAQLQEYFAGVRREFDIAYRFEGTEFQNLVWQQIALIPFGETRTYGELAKAIGRPKASRAVGAACGQNPFSIIVPCHRVVGMGNRLTGYAGGLDKKAWLLAFEQQQLRNS
jgi:methylated-DNA-[protein]-cysteine S-methyltransferase